MKQAIMTKPGKIKYIDVPVPEVGSNEIKIKMKVIGVCGSDIHVWHGQHPFTSYPVVQGHEISGIVEEVGKDVPNFSVGDVVTVQPQVVCGECYPCTHGLYNDCEVLKVMGFQTTGLASEYFVVDAKKALKLPDGMSLDHGAMIEPLAVAVHAIRRYGDIAGKNALIVGGGPIGNLVAQAAKAMGASKVLLSEISEYRLKVAEKCGIITVNPKDKILKDAIADNFGKDGADVIFECIGNAYTIKEIIDIARKGSEIIVVGVVPDLCEVNMGLVQDHELTIKGSAMYRVESWIEAIRLVNEGLIKFELLITHRVPFSDYASAYKLIEEQKDKAMKVLIYIEK
jgi:L-iditol 2-dehydrogenase